MKHKLPFGEPRSFIVVQEKELNAFVRKAFPELVDYSFSMAEDYSDGDAMIPYVVTRTMTTARRGEFDQMILDMKDYVGGSCPWYDRTGLILNKLCNAGMIEPGEYLIETA